MDVDYRRPLRVSPRAPLFHFTVVLDDVLLSAFIIGTMVMVHR